MDSQEITRRRESLELTQAKLAEAIGVNRVTLARWETGVSTPRGLSARQLGATLDRLEREAARRAARRAAYAARTAKPNDATLE
jgi:DNA-binding XRE family transcriptional regulator